MNNRNKGTEKETLAASFLITKNYTILEKNYRRKTGEIDLICRDPKDTIVFVEVKYRKSTRKGYPEEAVTFGKTVRIYRTAEWYLSEHHQAGKKCRFDVVAIQGEEIRHIKNAFGGI